jgi:hypothetical protein
LKVNAPETAAGRLRATVRKDGVRVTGVWTQRFARMRYVVTGLVPARIEVRPSNGLGGSIHPDLESQMHLASANKQAPATESWITM